MRWLPEEWDKEADVVVVGFGAAGSIAAIEAHDRGAKVIIIEHRSSGGGSCRLSGGTVYACDTSIQKVSGTADSPDEMYKYVVAIGDGLADTEHVRVWANNCGKLVDWLIGLGVEFQGCTFTGVEKQFASISDPMPRGHIIEGKGLELWKVLEKNVMNRGIERLFRTRGRELIVQYSANKTGVMGVKATRFGKTMYIKAKKGIILCTGGFCTNAAFFKKFCTQSLPCEPNPMMDFDNGDGIAMAHAIGADFFAIDNVGLRTLILRGWPPGFAGYVRHPPSGSYIWVNLEGKRFMNETTFYGNVPSMVGKQKDARCFMIFDEAAKKTGGEYIGWAFSSDLSKEIALGTIKTADTIKELAQMIQIDPDTLENTVDKWNEHTVKGIDPDFGRTKGAPIAIPPYYLGYLENYMGYNYGGIKINPKCQVLDVFENVIYRLYAAGSTTGGCIGRTHPGGGSLLSKSMTFGRIAGKNAASEKSYE